MRNPYVQSWNLSIQREIAKDTVIEVRYVGNKSTHKWHLYGVQEVNIFENGFLKEFTNAQSNLAINQAAGVNSFQNRGLSGTSGAPHLRGGLRRPRIPAGACQQPGMDERHFHQPAPARPGRFFRLHPGRAVKPDVLLPSRGQQFRSVRGSRIQRSRALSRSTSSFPNPYVADLTITDDNSWSTYHGLQLELRRRLRNGLSLTANYAFSKGLSDMQNTGSTVNSQYYRTIRNFGLDKAPMPSDLRHTLSLYGTYDLPVGQGRHFAVTNPVLNHIVGGWTISGIMRLTSGSVSSLTSGQRTFNNNADCGVILNGLSVSAAPGDDAGLQKRPDGHHALQRGSLARRRGRARQFSIPGAPDYTGTVWPVHLHLRTELHQHGHVGQQGGARSRSACGSRFRRKP